jgi:hypothetical protein
MRSGPGTAAGFLLARAGQMPDPGQGAPLRVPVPNVQGFKGGSANETEYQKQLFLSLQRSTPVVVPTSFQRAITIGFNLTTADTLALLAPPEIRSFMLIRNDPTSAGNVLIALDTQAQASTAMVGLVPGGVALFDFFVPQNDIHVAAQTLTALCVITYANARFMPGPV